MSATTQRRIRTPRPRKKRPESTGFPAPDEQPVTGGAADERPLSTAWITKEWIDRAVDVWSEAYGRPISEDEAVEILVNLKRFAEVLLKARKEMDAK